MVSGVVISITMQSSKGSYLLYFAILIDSLFFTLTAAAGGASVPIREPSRFWRDPVLGGSGAVLLIQRRTTDADRIPPMARKIYPPATAAIAAAAAAYAAARAALESAETAKASASAALLEALQDAALDCAATPSGNVTVAAGRRTVKVIDPALAAEIKLIQERGVRTGRAVETIGGTYPILRSFMRS